MSEALGTTLEYDFYMGTQNGLRLARFTAHALRHTIRGVLTTFTNPRVCKANLHVVPDFFFCLVCGSLDD